jgi:hypothetical protein
MSTVIHLKWGEQPDEPRHFLVTRLGRVRGDDFYVNPAAGVHLATPNEARSFASLASALREAEAAAHACGVDTIYVRLTR